MTYSVFTISRDSDGREVVRAPRRTDAIGHALRGAFDGNLGLSDDMVRLLRKLDGAGDRLN